GGRAEWKIGIEKVRSQPKIAAKITSYASSADSAASLYIRASRSTGPTDADTYVESPIEVVVRAHFASSTSLFFWWFLTCCRLLGCGLLGWGLLFCWSLLRVRCRSREQRPNNREPTNHPFPPVTGVVRGP